MVISASETYAISHHHNLYIKPFPALKVKPQEFLHIVVAIIVFAAVIAFPALFRAPSSTLPQAFLFAALIIIISVLFKKTMAALLETDAEHHIWGWSRWGLHKQDRFATEIPVGILLPLFFSLISLGTLKVATFLASETTIKKTYPSRAFGRDATYSYLTLTDWHNALIASAGIIGVLLLSFISYFLPFDNIETLARLAAFYAFWNLLPISTLDGSHILFGSRILWSTLALLTLVFTVYALVLV